MTKKNLLKRIKHRIRPRWMSTLRRVAISRAKLASVSRQLGLRSIDGNPLRAVRSSDTLFILGSGGSIATLTEDEWKAIRSADSVGFNFWPIHDHVPDLYVTEICDVPAGQEQNYQAYCDLMAARAADYANTPILIKDGERVRREWLEAYIRNLPESLRHNIALSWDWEFPDNDEPGMVATLRTWARYGLLDKSSAPLLRKRASVFYMVMLGLRAGYREIVLCGVDLDNNDYFYRIKEAEYLAKGRPVPQPVYATSVVHKTDNAGFGEMTLSRALAILDREILKPRGIQLKVALRSSRLYPMLPDHFGR
ncbi:MAG: hypothetical protein H6R10_1623 [Rhodocyclaceae bacterium]|nr:hypothetical protein [Rhodocyclaceae bacterium]